MPRVGKFWEDEYGSPLPDCGARVQCRTFLVANTQQSKNTLRGIQKKNTARRKATQTIMVLDDQQSMSGHCNASIFCLTQVVEIGVLLTAFGMFFTFLGVLMFFDRGLLAIGNVCFSVCTAYSPSLHSSITATLSLFTTSVIVELHFLCHTHASRAKIDIAAAIFVRGYCGIGIKENRKIFLSKEEATRYSNSILLFTYLHHCEFLF
jgi:hypothetical protein